MIIREITIAARNTRNSDINAMISVMNSSVLCVQLSPSGAFPLRCSCMVSLVPPFRFFRFFHSSNTVSKAMPLPAKIPNPRKKFSEIQIQTSHPQRYNDRVKTVKKNKNFLQILMASGCLVAKLRKDPLSFLLGRAVGFGGVWECGRDSS